jgi:hypothetical protein
LKRGSLRGSVGEPGEASDHGAQRPVPVGPIRGLLPPQTSAPTASVPPRARLDPSSHHPAKPSHPSAHFSRRSRVSAPRPGQGPGSGSAARSARHLGAVAADHGVPSRDAR